MSLWGSLNLTDEKFPINIIIPLLRVLYSSSNVFLICLLLPYSKMESLLCNEMWLMSPNNVQESDDSARKCVVLFSGDDDWQEGFRLLLNKEARYLPEPGYLMLLRKDDFVRNSRLKAVRWLIMSQKRLNLTTGTVFTAASYLDRFISVSQCQGWNDLIFELLSVACLSVAVKFNEPTALPLCEFQMEGLDHFFAPNLIQRMELTLLKGLEWRMDSTTPFSYAEFLMQSIHFCSFKDRVTELLISCILDLEFLEFRPYFIAISAVQCVFGDALHQSNTENTSVLAFLDSVIPQHQKDFLMKCQQRMGKLQHYNILACENSWSGPSSPVTVLLKDECKLNFDDCQAELSFLNMESRKRKREQQKNRVDLN